MSSDNISKVMATVGEDELEGVLEVPRSKRNEFLQQSSTIADYRRRLIKYFIKYSHWATWSDLTGWLYRNDQPEAMKAARAFIKQAPGKLLHILKT